jgi:hypothetical protein
MRRLAGLLAVFALLLLQAAGAAAQTSDFEVIEAFKRGHQTLLGSIKAAGDAAQCAGLETEIGRLEAEYAPHRKLLAEGLFPESFDTAIATLRDQLDKARERVRLAEESRRDKAKIEVISREAEEAGKKIEVISRQNEEFRVSVDRLTLEVKDLTGQLERLAAENTGLQKIIKTLQAENRRDKESIARLQELVEKLNANIRDRDELIMRMMDGMFGEYAKAGLTDARRRDLFVDAQGNDYVGKIVATLDGNVKHVEGTLLSPRDVQFAREEHRKLSDKWGQIKPALARIYPDEQIRTRDLATVDGRVADWKRGIDQATWRGIHQAFVGQNLDIGSFQNGGEFSARLLAYVDGQVKNPSRGAYREFRRAVWDSPLKDQWLPLLPIEELSRQQRDEIESRIAQWDQAVAALVRRWVLIGVAAAVLAVLLAVIAVILVRSRRKPTFTV